LYGIVDNDTGTSSVKNLPDNAMTGVAFSPTGSLGWEVLQPD